MWRSRRQKTLRRHIPSTSAPGVAEARRQVILFEDSFRPPRHMWRYNISLPGAGEETASSARGPGSGRVIRRRRVDTCIFHHCIHRPDAASRGHTGRRRLRFISFAISPPPPSTHVKSTVTITRTTSRLGKNRFRPRRRGGSLCKPVDYFSFSFLFFFYDFVHAVRRSCYVNS